MSQNINIVYLCADVPLDASNSRQLLFTSPEEQIAYFAGKAIKQSTDFKYVREERALKVPYNTEDIQHANYIAFYNGGLGTPTRWVFGYVDRIQYVNPNVSAVYFTVDAWQTYGLITDIRECDITREHTPPGDAWNANTVPEGLEYGDLVCVHEERFYMGSPDTPSFVMLCSVDLSADPGTKEEPLVNVAPGGIAAGLPSACGVYLINAATSSILDIFTAMKEYPWVAQGVISITYCPSALIPEYEVVSSPMGFSIGVVGAATAEEIEQNFSVLDHFPKVRNRKLYCSPYSSVEFIGPDGNGKTFKPELFVGGNFTLKLIGSVVPSMGVLFTVLPYDGMSETVGNGIAYNSFPSFPVPQSGYATTVAQMNSTYELNRGQAKTNRIFGFFQNVLGAIQGGTGSQIASGIGSAVVGYAGNVISDQQAAERERLAIQQHSEGTSLTGLSSGGDSVLLAHDGYHYAIRFFALKPEWRERLDSYFDAYGYKVNRLGRPHIDLRPRYNYIKCASVNIYGAIPSIYLQQIRQMFLNGVTFWKDHANVGTYGNNG